MSLHLPAKHGIRLASPRWAGRWGGFSVTNMGTGTVISRYGGSQGAGTAKGCSGNSVSFLFFGLVVEYGTMAIGQQVVQTETAALVPSPCSPPCLRPVVGWRRVILLILWYSTVLYSTMYVCATLSLVRSSRSSSCCLSLSVGRGQ